MIARTARLAGLAAALTAAVTLAGCGAGATGLSSTSASPHGAAPSPTDSRTPLQILESSIPDEKSLVYHFSVKGADLPMTGVIDSTRKTAVVEFSYHNASPSFTTSMTVLLTAKKSWGKITFTPALAGLPRMPKQWMLVDPQKVKDKTSPFLNAPESDPGLTNEVFDSASHVKQTGAGHFSGTTDLSLTNDDILAAEQLKALGSKAHALSFTATVDGQGRLTSAAVKVPAAGKFKAGTYQVTYDGYGHTRTPSLPAAADQTKATAAFYDFVNS